MDRPSVLRPVLWPVLWIVSRQPPDRQRLDEELRLLRRLTADRRSASLRLPVLQRTALARQAPRGAAKAPARPTFPRSVP